MNIDDNIVSEDGFISLFNGIDQEGWTIAGPGRFRVIEHERALELESLISENQNKGSFRIVRMYNIGFIVNAVKVVKALSNFKMVIKPDIAVD